MTGCDDRLAGAIDGVPFRCTHRGLVLVFGLGGGRTNPDECGEGGRVAAGMIEQLQLGDHVCGFVDDTEGWFDVIARTVTAGLGAGNRVMVFVDRLLPAALVAGLEARGVALEPAIRAGQVQIFPAREVYLPAGRFEPQPLLDSLVDLIERAVAEGYPGLRLLGDMGWVLDEPAGVEQLPWYEAQVNRLYMCGRALGICLYDRRGVDATLQRSLACAHPVIAMNAAEAEWPPQLRIRRTDEPYGLRLVGEVDLSNRQALAAVLDAVLDEKPASIGPIVIDVAGLQFADAATGAALSRLALRAPMGVHVTGAHGVVSAVLDRLDLAHQSGMRITGEAGASLGLTGVTGTEKVA